MLTTGDSGTVPLLSGDTCLVPVCSISDRLFMLTKQCTVDSVSVGCGVKNSITPCLISFQSDIQKSAVSFAPGQFSSPTNSDDPTIHIYNTPEETDVLKSISDPQQLQPGRRKRGRPPSRINMTYNAATVPVIADSDDNHAYSPNYFWCPACCMTYAAPKCPVHVCLTLPDNIVSYARLSLPPDLKLIKKGARHRVILTKRLQPLTKFGPVVAPLIPDELLRENPSWQMHCPFRMDLFDTNTQTEAVKYFKMGDESLCNWMMFVQLSDQHINPTVRCQNPNAVAYQQGSDGIFFLTTRYIRPGEELVVTYAPPYARRCGLALRNISTRPSASMVKTSPPDEIHCFRCSVTFNSEEAFRIHCLGHPDELLQRGFLQPPKSTSVERFTSIDKSPFHLEQEGFGELQLSSSKRSLFKNPQSVFAGRPLCCSLCSVEVNGLTDLIQHNDLLHSVANPKIFKASATMAADAIATQSGTNDLEDVNIISLDKMCSNLADIVSLPLTTAASEAGDEGDFLVVDLNHASQNLLERPLLWAYGCGVCSQRFPNLLALEQHKPHTCLPHSGSTASQLPPIQISSGSLTPPPRDQKVNYAGAGGDAVGTAAKSQSFTSATSSSALFNQLREIVSIGDQPSGQDSSHDESATSTLHVDCSSNIQRQQIGFSCDTCCMRFTTRSSYSVHMRAHDFRAAKEAVRSAKRAQQAKRSSSRQLVSPASAKSAGSATRGFFSCRVCNERLDNHATWRQHGIQHQRASDHRYPCPICCAQHNSNSGKVTPEANPRVYDTFHQLQRHMRHAHGNHIFPCPYCPGIFGRRQGLNSHLSHHTGQRDFACSDCGRTFARKDNLDRHRRMHTS